MTDHELINMDIDLLKDDYKTKATYKLPRTSLPHYKRKLKEKLESANFKLEAKSTPGKHISKDHINKDAELLTSTILEAWNDGRKTKSIQTRKNKNTEWKTETIRIRDNIVALTKKIVNKDNLLKNHLGRKQYQRVIKKDKKTLTKILKKEEKTRWKKFTTETESTSAAARTAKINEKKNKRFEYFEKRRWDLHRDSRRND